MRFMLIVVPILLATSAAAALGACRNQSEGDVCNQLAGDDCESGFVCTLPRELNTDFTTATDPNIGRCCPANRAAATVDICRTQVNPSGADAATPTDTPAFDGGDADEGGDDGAASSNDAAGAG